MRKILPAGLLLLLGLASGCGGSRPVSTEARSAPPHGGMMLTLPDSKGFVEIVNTPSAKKADTTRPEFTVYFLGPDRATPLSPAPSLATLTLETPKGTQTVDLKPLKNALISTPGPSKLSGHEMAGEIAFDLDGKAIKLPLAGR